MENSRKSSLEMHTLVVCADVQFLGATRGVLSQLKVTPRIVGDCEAALAAIQEHEFDAIVVDWREISNLEDFLGAVRRSKVNRECVVVAIVYDLLDLRQAFAAGVHLLIHKPASVVQIERCFRAAYCASVVRRRKRHREPVNIVASSSTRTQPFAEVTIANLGEGGARAKLACDSGAVVANLSVGAEVNLRFALPETNDMLQCTGMVVWTSPDGDAGIRFSYIPDRERVALEQWLTVCVERSRAELCERVRADCA
jgi:DNA-binding NarL/FixJ family response regulator